MIFLTERESNLAPLPVFLLRVVVLFDKIQILHSHTYRMHLITTKCYTLRSLFKLLVKTVTPKGFKAWENKGLNGVIYV